MSEWMIVLLYIGAGLMTGVGLLMWEFVGRGLSDVPPIAFSTILVLSLVFWPLVFFVLLGIWWERTYADWMTRGR